MRGPHILIHAFLYFIYLFINYVNVNHGRVLLVLEKLIKMHFIAVDFYKLQKRKKKKERNLHIAAFVFVMENEKYC